MRGPASDRHLVEAKGLGKQKTKQNQKDKANQTLIQRTSNCEGTEQVDHSHPTVQIAPIYLAFRSGYEVRTGPYHTRH